MNVVNLGKQNRDPVGDRATAVTRRESPQGDGRAPLVGYLLAAAGGTCIDRWLALPLAVWLSLTPLLLMLSGLSVSRRRGDIWSQTLLWLTVASLFAGWHHFRWHSAARDDLLQFTGARPQPACVEGTLVAGVEVLRRPRRVFETPEEACTTRFEIRPRRVKQAEGWSRVGGRCQVSVDGQVSLPTPGTRLRLYGELARPLPARNPGEFDQREHLRGMGVHSVLSLNGGGAIELAPEQARWRNPLPVFREWLVQRLAGNLQRHFSEQHASVLEAVLLGRRERLTLSQKEQYARTGTSHLLAISGLHLSILAGPWLLLGRLGWWRLSAAIGVAILLSWLYCWLMEMKPPLVRATLLLTVLGIAKLNGRRVFHRNTLALAGLALLLLNPSYLFRIGPQLSFLAVLAIAQFSEHLTAIARPRDPLQRLQREARSRGHRGVRRLLWGMTESVLLCGWVWMITAPLVASRFHLLAWTAPLVNPPVLLVMPLVMYSAVAVAVLGGVAGPLAEIVAWPAQLGLTWIKTILELAEQSPSGWQWVAGPPIWWLLLFYGCYLARIALDAQPLGWRARCLAGSLLGVALWLPPQQAALIRHGWLPPRPLDVTIMDVGHGTAVLVQFPSGKNLLYDAGGMGGERLVARRISHCLWSERIQRLDTVVISHADADHFNALQELLERFEVGEVLVEPSMLDAHKPGWMQVREKLQRYGIPLSSLHAGMSKSFNCRSEESTWEAREPPRRLSSTASSSAVELDVLHPPKRMSAVSDNERSLVLRLQHQGRELVLPGDLEGPRLKRWLAQAPRSTGILAPHHGSGLIPIAHLVEQMRPMWVLISGGWHANSAQVVERYGAGGAVVLHTSQTGAIRVRNDHKGWRVYCWRTQERGELRVPPTFQKGTQGSAFRSAFELPGWRRVGLKE